MMKTHPFSAFLGLATLLLGHVCNAFRIVNWHAMQSRASQAGQFALIFSLLLVSCRDSQTQNNSGEAKTIEKITTVKVVHPKGNGFVAEISIVGTVVPNKKVMLHAMENGVMTKMLVDIGDKVSKGETIAELANPELL